MEKKHGWIEKHEKQGKKHAVGSEIGEDWFQLVPGLLERGWAEALRRPEGSLSHRPCPWGASELRNADACV